MTPERWQQVKAVLDAALACEPQERLAFISKACEGDEPLRKELQSLIVSDEQAGNFIEEKSFNFPSATVTESGSEWAVDRKALTYVYTKNAVS